MYQAFEFQLTKDRKGLISIYVSKLSILFIKGYGSLSIYGCKLLGKLGHVIMILKVLTGPFGRDLISMSMGIFYRAIGLYDRGGSFFSYPWNSWNVVGGVTHKCLKIYKLRRRYTVLFLYIIRIIIKKLRPAL